MRHKFFGVPELEFSYEHQHREVKFQQTTAADDICGVVVTNPETLLGVVEMVAKENPDFAKGIGRIHWRLSKRPKAVEVNHGK